MSFFHGVRPVVGSVARRTKRFAPVAHEAVDVEAFERDTPRAFAELAALRAGSRSSICIRSTSASRRCR